MRYKQFILDDFQVNAAKYLDKGNSVVVSAATGTGKTLIADYVIDKYIKKGSKIVYTAPIKALSNQKFREFRKEYGDKVGLITGDIVINDKKAQVLIMTTEIYRNMLLTQDQMINDISYVIFDEIHFINDFERGTVWEESIIFSPEHIRFLCLSATIPNAKEFADWIMSIKDHEVNVVKYDKRAVPLKHFFYDSMNGIVPLEKVKELIEINQYNDYYSFFGNRSKKGKNNKRADNFPMTTHIDLVKELRSNNFLPCIFFVFSRKSCEEKAVELVRKARLDFTTPDQKKMIIEKFREKLDSQYASLETVRTLRQVLPNGIAFHHAGLLPSMKEVVEELFNEGLIKVLYATETFAVGINMPAKTVAFSSLEKYDGYNFRYLSSKEYFQMAGRAGRRGIDKEGRAMALIDKNYNDVQKMVNLMSRDVEPIRSQFKLSYNTVLNLVNNYDSETIEVILKSSFDYYLRKKQRRDIRIMSSFKNAVKRLKRMDYIDQSGKITEKGEFARYIYQHELLITEIFDSGVVDMLSESEIICLLAEIVYEARRNDQFYKRKDPQYKRAFINIIDAVSENMYVAQMIDKRYLRKMIPMIYSWANGSDFLEIMEMTNLREGDVIRLIRQCVDFMRQILRATRKQERINKLQNCMDRIYRDVVLPEF
ncbi:MAG: DEAD/DEAH box helicase [Candidatus Woesearchaeota archaeon]